MTAPMAVPRFGSCCRSALLRYHRRISNPQLSKGGHMKRLSIATAFTIGLAAAAYGQDVPAEYQQVLSALGKQGDYKANVLKINIPRNDVSVTVANVKTPTPFGFGGWIAMTKGAGGM